MDEFLKKSLVSSYRSVPVSDSDFGVSSEYLEFLRHFGLNEKAQTTEGCGSKLAVLKCGCKKYVGSWFCNTKGCPNCDWLTMRRSVDDFMWRLGAMFSAARKPMFVWMLDFTIGEDLWDKVPRLGLAEFAELSYLVTWNYFNEKLGLTDASGESVDIEIGFDASPQYWHSRMPASGWVPHIHAVVPRLFFEKDSGKLLNLRLEHIDKDVLQMMWRSAVEARYGESKARFGGGYEKFSLWMKYTKTQRGLDKRLRYAYRGIEFDFNKEILGGSDYAYRGVASDVYLGIVEPSHEWLVWQADFVRDALTLRHKRHVGYGLFSGKNMSAESKYMQTLKLDFGTKKERDKLRRVRLCPHCGDMLEKDYDAPLMDRSEAVAKGYEHLKRKNGDEMRKWRDMGYVPY